ncbi:hypothetical protein ACFVT5_06035 [Streptomyces sp. NPDC058001]|uniref:hypothetical protein n=1 Tax=Streptomyces sp. NPDC058001 TaxID=3346300 RepID=UPI0036EAF633
MTVSLLVRQCTATADVPLVGLLFAILAGQGRVLDSELDHAPLRARCELGHEHDGEHADHVWDWDHKPTHALWARWNTDATIRFETLHWCETQSEGGPDDDACTLYLNHAQEHSWNVHDPETEAPHREALAENALMIRRLGRKPDQSGGG